MKAAISGADLFAWMTAELDIDPANGPLRVTIYPTHIEVVTASLNDQGKPFATGSGIAQNTTIIQVTHP